jgi:hypothetical protein
MTTRQVIFFLLTLGLFAYTYLNENARERLVTNSWQPIPALLALMLAPGFPTDGGECCCTAQTYSIPHPFDTALRCGGNDPTSTCSPQQ